MKAKRHETAVLRIKDVDTLVVGFSAEEKRLVDERVAAYRQNPNSVVTWAVAEDAIRRQHGLWRRS